MLLSVIRGTATAMLLFVGAAQAQQSELTQALRLSVEELRNAGPAGPSLEGVSLTEGVARFYERRDYAAAWTEAAPREALVAQLKNMASDGLDPADYATARIAKGPDSQAATVLATYDVMATRNFLLALAHLFRGKVDPSSLDAQWNFDARSMTPDEALGYILDAVKAGDLAQVFDGARPKHFAYERMRERLKRLREIQAAGGWKPIADGPQLAPGADDARVAVLRKRLADAGYLATDADNGSHSFDETVTAAVKLFQTKQYLEPDGAVGPATRAALNTPLSKRIGQLRANLERGRWLLHQLHDEFLLVDIAGFEVGYYKNLKPVWTSPVQVGKPFRMTPVFKSEINTLTLNPTWTVPPTVLREDILPKARADSGFLKRMHIRVYGENGAELDAGKIDWKKPGYVTLRQDPGPGNSLGRAVVRFPNPYSVFLHDTPHREHYAEAQRAYSSGCIRVEKIDELARLLLTEEGWKPEDIDAAMAGKDTNSIALKKQIPVLLGYWTVDLPEDGRLAFKADIYGRDPPLIKALDQAPQ